MTGSKDDHYWFPCSSIWTSQETMPHFNRAMLMNIGYKEALRQYGYKCVIFHDVDLIPEMGLNLYSCPEHPRHMSVAIDNFKYKYSFKSFNILFSCTFIYYCIIWVEFYTPYPTLPPIPYWNLKITIYFTLVLIFLPSG